MRRRLLGLALVALLAVSTSGCAALLVGAAGATGTAVWFSGKLGQDVNASPEQGLKAVKSALSSLKFEINKQTITTDFIQVLSKTNDGETVWIDIHRISDSVSRVEVRVGIPGEQEAARKILDKIVRYAGKG